MKTELDISAETEAKYIPKPGDFFVIRYGMSNYGGIQLCIEAALSEPKENVYCVSVEEGVKSALLRTTNFQKIIPLRVSEDKKIIFKLTL